MTYAHKSNSVRVGIRKAMQWSIACFCFFLVFFIGLVLTSYPMFTRWENKWQSERVQSTIDQTEDLAKIRQMAKYACDRVDVTYKTLKGLNQTVVLLLLPVMSSYLVIFFSLYKVKDKNE